MVHIVMAHVVLADIFKACIAVAEATEDSQELMVCRDMCKEICTRLVEPTLMRLGRAITMWDIAP